RHPQSHAREPGLWTERSDDSSTTWIGVPKNYGPLEVNRRGLLRRFAGWVERGRRRGNAPTLDRPVGQPKAQQPLHVDAPRECGWSGVVAVAADLRRWRTSGDAGERQG